MVRWSTCEGRRAHRSRITNVNTKSYNTHTYKVHTTKTTNAPEIRNACSRCSSSSRSRNRSWSTYGRSREAPTVVATIASVTFCVMCRLRVLGVCIHSCQSSDGRLSLLGLGYTSGNFTTFPQTPKPSTDHKAPRALAEATRSRRPFRYAPPPRNAVYISSRKGL